uniref:Uncharacterized protein n=1 Tax=Cacopsylla melanoneura TaxID=428564 RepID=A0A8D8XGU7_9HEMI
MFLQCRRNVNNINRTILSQELLRFVQPAVELSNQCFVFLALNLVVVQIGLPALQLLRKSAPEGRQFTEGLLQSVRCTVLVLDFVLNLLPLVQQLFDFFF